MGAREFMVRGKGKTAEEAFSAAVDRARYMHGHGGYTGTIAEKDEFRMVRVPEGVEPKDYAKSLMYGEEHEDHWCQDKWGPAACIKIEDGVWLFFGRAPS